MRRFSLILVCLLIAGCEALSPPAPKPADSVQPQLEAAVAAGALEFDFTTATAFSWETMFVFDPYSNRSEVEKSLGFIWPDYRRTSIESLDGINLVVFIENGRVVHWYEQSRAIDFDDVARRKERFAREEVRFMIDRTAHVTLRPLPLSTDNAESLAPSQWH